MTDMLTLVTLDGRKVFVNPSQIASISEAREAGDPNKQYTDRVHSVLTLSNGKMITVEESCDDIWRRLKGE